MRFLLYVYVLREYWSIHLIPSDLPKMSELDSQYVKQGYWVNQKQGTIMGQTLTTDIRTGTFVITLLAIMTLMGMKHLWNLFTFCSYQIRANGRPSDGLFRQQQALLRSSPTPSTLLVGWIKLWFTWRRINKRAAATSSVHTFTALVFMIGSLTASIFSSNVVSTSNLEVLVSSPHCGYLDFNVEYHNSYVASIQGSSTLTHDIVFGKPNLYLAAATSILVRTFISVWRRCLVILMKPYALLPL